MKNNNSNEMIINKSTDKGFDNYNNKKYLSKALQKYLDEKIRIENEGLFMNNVEKIQELLIRTDNINDLRKGKIPNTAKNSQNNKIQFNQEINQYNTNINFYFPNETYASEMNNFTIKEIKNNKISKCDPSERMLNSNVSDYLFTSEIVGNNSLTDFNKKSMNSDKKSCLEKRNSKLYYKHGDKGKDKKPLIAVTSSENLMKESEKIKDKILTNSNDNNESNINYLNKLNAQKEQNFFAESTAQNLKVNGKTDSQITNPIDLNNEIYNNLQLKSSLNIRKDMIIMEKNQKDKSNKPMLKNNNSQFNPQKSKKKDETIIQIDGGLSNDRKRRLSVHNCLFKKENKDSFITENQSCKNDLSKTKEVFYSKPKEPENAKKSLVSKMKKQNVPFEKTNSKPYYDLKITRDKGDIDILGGNSKNSSEIGKTKGDLKIKDGKNTNSLSLKLGFNVNKNSLYDSSFIYNHLPKTSKNRNVSNDLSIKNNILPHENSTFKTSDDKYLQKNCSLITQNDRPYNKKTNKTLENSEFLGKSYSNLTISHCPSVNNLEKNKINIIQNNLPCKSQIKDFESENELDEEDEKINESLDMKNENSLLISQSETCNMNKLTYFHLNGSSKENNYSAKKTTLCKDKNKVDPYFSADAIKHDSSVNDLKKQINPKKSKIHEPNSKTKPVLNLRKTTNPIFVPMIVENNKSFAKSNKNSNLNKSIKKNYPIKNEKGKFNLPSYEDKDSINIDKLCLNQKQAINDSVEKITSNKKLIKSNINIFPNKNNLNKSCDKSILRNKPNFHNTIIQIKENSKGSSKLINKDKIGKLSTKTENKLNNINSSNNNHQKSTHSNKMKIESYLSKGKNHLSFKKNVDEKIKESISIKNKNRDIESKNLHRTNTIREKTLSASKIKSNFKNIKSRFLKHFDMENMNSTISSNCNLELNDLKELIYLPKKIKSVSNFLNKSGTYLSVNIPKLRIDSISINSEDHHNLETQNNNENTINNDEEINSFLENEIKTSNETESENINKLNDIKITIKTNPDDITNIENIDVRNKDDNFFHMQSNDKMNFAFLEEELNDMIKNSNCFTNFNLFDNEVKSSHLLKCEEIENLVFQEKN